MLGGGNILCGEIRQNVRGGGGEGIGGRGEDDRREGSEERVPERMGREVRGNIQVSGCVAEGILRRQRWQGSTGGDVRKRVCAENDVRELFVQKISRGEQMGRRKVDVEHRRKSH